MSQFFPATAVCPACGNTVTIEFPASINADRRPDLRAAIVNGSLYTHSCQECGQQLTFEPHLTYLDVSRGQWIVADAAGTVTQWRAAEASASGIYDRAFGASAPEAARALGPFKPRIVFGWSALVEKMLCCHLSLDDKVLELVKFAIIRHGPSRAINPGHAIRLVGTAPGTLQLVWLNTADNTTAERMDVPVSVYTSIAENLAPWSFLIDILAGSMFVDVARLLHDPAALS